MKMTKAVFKLSRSASMLAIASAAQIFIFTGGLRLLLSGEFDILDPLLWFSGLLGFSVFYVVKRVRLRMDEEGISLDVPIFSLFSWRLSWKDADEALLIYAPLGQSQIVFQAAKIARKISPPVWVVDSSERLALEDCKPSSTIWSRNKPDPKCTAIFAAVSYFVGSIKEASSSEAAEIFNKQLNFGERTGHVAYSAVALMIGALALKFLDSSINLDYGYTLWVIVPFAIMAFAGSIYYLKNANNKGISLFVSALAFFGVCWVLYSIVSLLGYVAGEKVLVNYSLERIDGEHQVWTVEGRDELQLDLWEYDKDFKYQEIGDKTQLTVIAGAFGSFSVSKSEIEHSLFANEN